MALVFPEEKIANSELIDWFTNAVIPGTEITPLQKFRNVNPEELQAQIQDKLQQISSDEVYQRGLDLLRRYLAPSEEEGKQTAGILALYQMLSEKLGKSYKEMTDREERAQIETQFQAMQ